MVEVTVQQAQGIADFKLPEGCPACGGAISVRLMAGTSWGYCPNCRWLGRKQVALENNALHLVHMPGGLA
jgi:hypothetical protein